MMANDPTFEPPTEAELKTMSLGERYPKHYRDPAAVDRRAAKRRAKNKRARASRKRNR